MSNKSKRRGAIPNKAPVAAAPQQTNPDRRISHVTLAAASVKPPQQRPATPWTIPKPPPGVVPNNTPTMAQDDAIGTAYGYAGSSLVGGHMGETVGWLGFPYLAELCQRPEYRRISETLAREATRKWITIQTSGDEDKSDKVKAIDAAFDKLKLRDVFRRVSELDGYFGRSHLYLDFDSSDDPDELVTPLLMSPKKIPKGGLKGVRIVEPFWVFPSAYNSTNPLRSDYYKPTSWWVMGKQVHASRLLTFIGREVPDILKPSFSMGGLSLSQMAQPYIDNFLRTRNSVSDLVHSFSVSGIKTNMAATLTGTGGDDMLLRAQLFNQTRDNRGLYMLDKETEEYFNVATPLSTLDHLLAQSQEQIASVVGQPLVVMLGITPSGLNASSDGEMRAWFNFVNSYQEHLFRSNLETVLKVVQLSEFGVIDPEISVRFENLWELNDTERAVVRKTDIDSDVELIAAGIISPEEARNRLANAEDSLYHGLDVSDVPDPPEDEEDPSLTPDPAKPGGEKIGSRS